MVVVGLVLVFLVYGPMSRTVASMGTVTISGNLIGTQGLSIELTASGGTVAITSITIYDPSGNTLLTLPAHYQVAVHWQSITPVAHSRVGVGR
ncbi:hypothetical protein [Vulcanisaeta sp. JCM 16159]|uniref:hypothetical protein n=1 Tax=Vulcanisaeta sp. JCM 16159 TaxID=1295371 RepID=UPI001FB2EDD0|nr:hypothetical protein [Vulcanisaeta sp. JCM 16159]